MKQVVFKSLFIQNFLSIGNEPLKIDFTRGVNAITGTNLDKEESKNGVGKSSIADAIYFCLFGVTIRELKKEYIPNRFTKGVCKTMLSFDIVDGTNIDHYVATRTIKPTEFKLLRLITNDKNEIEQIDITKSSMQKTSDFVCGLISSTAEVFLQSILMSVNITTPFMALKKVEKRKFIEGILKLGIFSDILNNVRQDFLEIKKEVDAENIILDGFKRDLITFEDNSTNFETSKQNKIFDYQKRIEAGLSEIEQLKNDINVVSTEEMQSLKNNINLIETNETKYSEQKDELQLALSTQSVEIQHRESAIENLKQLGPACIKCRRPFSENELHNHEEELAALEQEIVQLKNKKDEILNSLEQQKELISRCKKAVSKFNNDLHVLALRRKENDNKRDRIQRITDINAQTNNDIENIKNEHNQFQVLITETKQKIQTNEQNLKALEKKLKIFDAAKFVVSEEGVKSFIVKKILQLLNHRLSIYLDKLQANCQCMFNEYFEETIIDSKGHECSYHNFSGGERKRIDLAMLFTFQDIRRLQGEVSINLSMYDELLDSSLDGKGIECVLNILKERVENYNECIYIITHNSHAMNITIDNVIKLVKYNGITKIQE